MDDQALRTLVRDAVKRHLGRASAPEAATSADAGLSGRHPSHGLYLILHNGTDGCLIEPSVPCTHCGYCQSHGH